MGPNAEAPGLPANLALVDEWISANGDIARERADEIAVLLGETWVCQGGKWRISLSLRHSLIVFRDGREMSPFLVVERRLTDENMSLAQCLELLGE